MSVCRNCNNPIPNKAKICPSCGAKNKKPFYQRGWFIVLAVLVVIGVIGSIGRGSGSKGEKFDWNDMELSSVLPEPKSNVGEIISNSEDGLSIYVHKTSKDEYKDYLSKCQDAGFTVESDKSENNYSAFNKDGYKLWMLYNDDEEILDINLDAPMKMGTLQWPESEIARLLPVPKSSVGNILNESSDGFTVYVGETSVDDYNAYVKQCSEKGFSVDYDKGDTYYYADDAGGYHISLNYEGNNVMRIEIEKPEKSAKPKKTTKPKKSSSDKSSDDDKDNSVTKEPEPDSGKTTELVDGMRPEFKEAMDSYEAFYDEYCEFMKEYKDNPDDLGLLAKYTDMMSKAVDMNEKFEAWNQDEMNDAELKYYLKVNSRVTKKLAEAAQ